MFQKLPARKNEFRLWKTHTSKQIINGYRRPQEALEWSSKVEQASSIELAVDGAEFEKYSTTICLSLLSIIEGDFANKIELLEESMLRQNKRLNGRQ